MARALVRQDRAGTTSGEGWGVARSAEPLRKAALGLWLHSMLNPAPSDSPTKALSGLLLYQTPKGSRRGDPMSISRRLARRIGLVSSAFGAVSGVVGPALPASAHEEGSTPPGACGAWACAVSVMPDSSVNVSYWGPVPQNWKDAFNAAWFWSYNPTHLDVWTTADNINADLRVQMADFHFSGFYGWVNCPPSSVQGGAHPNHWCVDQTLKLDSSQINGAFIDQSADRRKSLTCHEFGHTVGLQHTAIDDQCMFNGLAFEPVWTGIVAHQADHLNARYP